jgi:hypothetical protein
MYWLRLSALFQPVVDAQIPVRLAAIALPRYALTDHNRSLTFG